MASCRWSSRRSLDLGDEALGHPLRLDVAAHDRPDEEAAPTAAELGDRRLRYGGRGVTMGCLLCCRIAGRSPKGGPFHFGRVHYAAALSASHARTSSTFQAVILSESLIGLGNSPVRTLRQ